VEEGIAACTFTMEYVKKFYLIPGQVENWIIFVDFGELGLMNIPFKVRPEFFELFHRV